MRGEAVLVTSLSALVILTATVFTVLRIPRVGPVLHTKRGIGAPAEYMSCGAHEALTQISWFYNWGPQPSSRALDCTAADRHEFVPMVWGDRIRAAEITLAARNGAKYLLGFNEPNHMEQSNLWPEAAAKLWPQVERVARENGLILGSPAAAECITTECLTESAEDWWDQWLAACSPSCEFEFLAVHYYGCSVSDLKSMLDRYAAKYGKPIWVTEVSCPSDSEDEEVEFLKKTLNMLDTHPDVQRYAWFSTRTDGWLGTTPSLLGPDLQRVTRLGQIYNQAPKTK